MKTTSLKHNKRFSSTKKKITLVVFFCLLAVMVEWLFPSFLFEIIYTISTPFTFTRDAIGGELSAVSSYFSFKTSLVNENAELKKDLAAANTALLSMQELETENQALENTVSSKQSKTPTTHTVFAAVTEKPPFSPYDSLIISAGSNEGLTLNNPVFDDMGTPIGTIGAVYLNAAKVVLFSSSNTTLSVTIGDKKYEISALGAGGGDFTAKVPATETPKMGDAVYIPTFAPRAVGIVKNISVGSTDAFARVSFSFPENIFEMSFVTIDTTRHFQTNSNTYEATSTNQ
jgi:cell shape-determining protein MreC